MIFEHLKAAVEIKDEDFDAIYPEYLLPMAAFHFTPIEVAKTSAEFLVNQPGTKVMDIGAGAGKFCMLGSIYTQGHFTGIEQSSELCKLSIRLSRQYQLSNLDFICCNITEVFFKSYDAFYFFNAFYENIDQSDRLDTSIEPDRRLYEKYSAYVREELDSLPIGTRLATYFSYLEEIPESYEIVSKGFEDKLLMWQKTF